eukprot:symbB.v1.2.018553.t1/scaffold1483.1/size116006/2
MKKKASARHLWTILLLSETLDALTCFEACALRVTKRLAAEVKIWRNVQFRSLEGLRRFQRLVGLPLKLRRIDLSSEVLLGFSSPSILASLEELCIHHLLVPSIATYARTGVFEAFCKILKFLPDLRVLDLPELICTAGGVEDFAIRVSKLEFLTHLRLPQAMLLECCTGAHAVAQAVKAQTTCWKVMAAQFSKMPKLIELDMTGALRPIAPEHLRPWPSEVSRPRSSMGDAATLTDVLGREVVPCEEDLLRLFELWSHNMSKINQCFRPGILRHEDWPEELRRAKVRLALLQSITLGSPRTGVVSMLSSFLEMAYDPDAEVPMLPPLPRVASRDRASIGGRASIAIGPQKPETISTWVETLVTMEADLDRGDLVDKLIKYDEQRLVGNQELVQESLFSHGRTIPVLLGRLNLASHFTTHERRTPLRTHLLKFLLNILSRNPKSQQFTTSNPLSTRETTPTSRWR